LTLLVTSVISFKKTFGKTDSSGCARWIKEWNVYNTLLFFFYFLISFSTKYSLFLFFPLRFLSVRNVVPTLTSNKRWDLSLDGRC
jgi:hypothetical protein